MKYFKYICLAIVLLVGVSVCAVHLDDCLEFFSSLRRSNRTVVNVLPHMGVEFNCQADSLSADSCRFILLGDMDEYSPSLEKILSDTDSRFLYVGDHMPVYRSIINGPARFLGSIYYVDYPSVRLIVINTSQFYLLSDFTIAQTWLARTLQEAGDKWKVVLMQRPIFSASIGNFSPVLLTAFFHTLQDADLVFAGHDYNYARRANHHLLQDNYTTPVFFVTTTSTNSLLPRCNIRDQRIGSCEAFYERIEVSKDTLQVHTYICSSDELYDAVTVLHDGTVLLPDSLMPERLSISDSYQNTSNIRERRSRNRLRFRQKEL